MGRSSRVQGSLLAVYALMGCVLAGSAEVARAQQACRARLLPPVEPELLRRIEGQLRDVACELELSEANEPALATLAIEAQPDGSYIVRVQPLEGQRRPGHSRHVRPTPEAAADTGDLARSALFEAVALVVRGELSELAAQVAARREASATQPPAGQGARGPTKGAGASVGETNAPKPGKPKPEAIDESQDDDAREPSEPGEHNERSAGVRLALGPELALAEDTMPAWGLSARVLIELQTWLLGAGGSFGLPYEARDARTELTLRRHSLRGYLGHALIGDARDAITLDLLTSVHVRFHERQTALRDAALAATSDSTSTSAGVGLELGLSVWPSRAFSVSLLLGADATLIGAPRFVYESADGERTQHTQPAALQPRATLLLELRL